MYLHLSSPLGFSGLAADRRREHALRHRQFGNGHPQIGQVEALELGSRRQVPWIGEPTGAPWCPKVGNFRMWSHVAKDLQPDKNVLGNDLLSESFSLWGCCKVSAAVAEDSDLFIWTCWWIGCCMMPLVSQPRTWLVHQSIRYIIYIYILNVPVLLFVNVEKRSPRHMKKLLELQDVGFNGR